MKIRLASLFLFLSFITSLDANATENVRYASININFDNTVTYTSPELLIDGEYYVLVGENVNNWNAINSVSGFCIIMGHKSYQTHNYKDFDVIDQGAVTLNSDGSIDWFYRYSPYFGARHAKAHKITCNP